jgi:hypothetical protein
VRLPLNRATYDEFIRNKIQPDEGNRHSGIQRSRAGCYGVGSEAVDPDRCSIQSPTEGANREQAS